MSVDSFHIVQSESLALAQNVVNIPLEIKYEKEILEEEIGLVR